MPSRAFPIAAVPDPCPLADQVTRNSVEIEHLKTEYATVEAKIDKLLWWLMATFAAACGGLLTAALKK